MSQEQPAAPTLAELLPEFLLFAKVEAGMAPQSIIKYQDRIRQILRICGDKSIESFDRGDVYSVKECMMSKGRAPTTIATTLLAFRRLLIYARDERKLSVMDPSEIRPPKRPRREVLFLTAADVGQFVGSIRTTTYQGQPHLAGIRFRALVEVLLGSGLRIGELLSINRKQLNLELREAKVVGKGSAERTVFFTQRAITFLQQYLETRGDEHEALFVTADGQRRWQRTDLWRYFARYSKLSGISKPVRPHILRHTAATTLLFNGCPIGHIQTLLGHARLETTCRYYLGVDRRAAKQAHNDFLFYSTPKDIA